jgi:hypothetical protein
VLAVRNDLQVRNALEALSADPSIPYAGLGLAVPVIPKPTGTCAAEIADIVRLAGAEDLAAAILRQVARLLVYVPPLTLLKLLDRWVTRLEDLGRAGEGAMLRIVHRLSRGKHKELHLLTKEPIR